MSPAVASLIALLFAIVLSIVSRINVGLVALALAWLVGVFVADMTPGAVIGGFPSNLFLTLTGVTLLFAAADANGTLAALTQRAVRLAGGNARTLPILFFLIACLITSIGPGSIAGVALVVPLAMSVGDRAGIPPFLTALMVANGANSGNLSPFSAVGVIVNNAMTEAGTGPHELKVWLANLLAHLLVAVVAYFLLGGHRLTGRAEEVETTLPPLTKPQWLTLGLIVTWVMGVVFFGFDIGLSAFVAIVVLIATSATDEGVAVRRVPWGVIVMVSGVSVLVALLAATHWRCL